MNLDIDHCYRRARGGWTVQFKESREYWILTLRHGYWRPRRQIAVLPSTQRRRLLGSSTGSL